MAKKQKSPIEILLEDIQTNQALLKEKELLLQQTRDEKKEISDLLKGFRKDISTLYKYVSDAEREKIDSLGFGPSTSSTGLNHIAQFALDVINEKKKISNGDLYSAYIDSLTQEEEPLTYTIFNVKIRSIFNTGQVTKQKNEDGKDTRDDVIQLL